LKHPSYIVGYLLKPDVVSDDSSIKNFIFDDQKLRKTLLFFAILKKKLAREKKTQGEVHAEVRTGNHTNSAMSHCSLQASTRDDQLGFSLCIFKAMILCVDSL